MQPGSHTTSPFTVKPALPVALVSKVVKLAVLETEKAPQSNGPTCVENESVIAPSRHTVPMR